MTGGNTPSGWYPDPSTPGQERWWDGVAWTEATRPAATPPTAPPPPPQPIEPPAPGTPSGYAPPPPPPPGYLPPPPGAQIGYGAPSFPGVPVGAPPPNYLAQAILVTLFCCLPFGIVSIVKAASVDGKWRSGDVAGAQTASQSAKNWALASFIVGLIVGVIYVIAVASAND